MATTIIRPADNDITATTVEGFGAASAPYYPYLDEGVGSQDGNGVRGIYNTAAAQYDCDLSATAANFTAATQVRIKTYIVFAGDLSGSDTLLLEVDLQTAASVSLIGGYQTVYNWTTGTPGNQLITNTIPSPTAGDKSTYDGAKLLFRWTKSKSGGWDSGTIGVDLSDVEIDYTVTVYPQAALATETDSALAPITLAIKVPQALETDTALGASIPVPEAGQPVSTETALTAGYTKTLPVGTQPTDTASALTPLGLTIGVPIATESEAALGTDLAIQVPLAVETDSSLTPLGLGIGIEQDVETDSSLPVAAKKVYVLAALALETDSCLTPIEAPKGYGAGQALETDSATALPKQTFQWAEVTILDPPVGTPGAGDSTLRYRAWRGTGSATLYFELVEGGSVTDSWSQALTASATTYEKTLSISNYTNLNLRWRAVAASGDECHPRISWVRLWVPEYSPSTPVAGLSIETDSAFAATAIETYTVGTQALETDSSLGAFVGDVESAGQALETDSSLGPDLTFTLSLAVETDSALAGFVGDVETVGSQALETDSCFAAQESLKIYTVGQATETDSGLAVSVLDVESASLAVETDTAFSATLIRVFLAGQSLETDTANAAARLVFITVAQSLETDTALVPTVLDVETAGLATETDTSNAVGVLFAYAAGLATETDTALGANPLKVYGAGQALETDGFAGATIVWIPNIDQLHIGTDVDLPPLIGDDVTVPAMAGMDVLLPSTLGTDLVMPED